jgi:hypothetical protein
MPPSRIGSGLSASFFKTTLLPLLAFAPSATQIMLKRLPLRERASTTSVTQSRFIGYLRNQDDIRPSGGSGVQSNPARIPSHHFDNHYTMV